MTPDPEQIRAEFEREKWRVDVGLRTRELDLREREQANRDAETELKRAEQASSRWRSPLVVAILAGAVAASGNAVVAWVNGTLQRDLESRKRDAEIRLEASKAETTRILEMIKTGDAESAARNLEFLLKTGLVTDPERVPRLTEFLASRAPGSGPSLPAPGARIGFEPTDAALEPERAKMQKHLEEFTRYLDRVGFPPAIRKVIVKIDKLPSPNAYYASNTSTIVIDTTMAADPSVPLHVYMHHVLGSKGPKARRGQQLAIESALADYFACSFLGNPRLGEASAPTLGPDRSYIRILANDRKFSEFKNLRDDLATMPYAGAEIWGGALWAIRDRLGREPADSIIAEAWLGMAWPASESERAPGFVSALLKAAAAKGSTQSAPVTSVLRAREFPVGG
jgi:hypothetical protein